MTHLLLAMMQPRHRVYLGTQYTIHVPSRSIIDAIIFICIHVVQLYPTWGMALGVQIKRSIGVRSITVFVRWSNHVHHHSVREQDISILLPDVPS
jgi:hypothetical protein